ncbi:hypothetical protein K440DRAFT_657298 [Wilcoxina mikolae CBS 423.85]|nr:hypothetical protein K440DRAFT_657298 [Wilcoxina mikolae CBS 423.85]
MFLDRAHVLQARGDSIRNGRCEKITQYLVCVVAKLSITVRIYPPPSLYSIHPALTTLAMFFPLPRLLLSLAVFTALVSAAPATVKPGVSSAKWKSKKAASLIACIHPFLAPLSPEEAACAPDQPTAFVYTCYATLDMDGYFRDWWMNNRGLCDGLGFAQCFLKYNHYAGLTCDQITTDTCGPPDSNGNWDSIQQFYGVWNIYTVHQFFSQYYTALGLAQGIALGRVGEIVATLSPPQAATMDGKIAAILIAFSLGELAMGKELITAATPALAIAMKMRYVGISALAGGSAQMANYLWGTSHGGPNQETLQIADIQNKLSDMTIAYMNQLTVLVKQIQADPVAFLTLCQFGGFSERIDSSLPTEVNNILNQLTLYVLGTVLKAKNAIIAINQNKSPIDEAQATSLVVCPSLDNYNSCGQWWYDADTHTTYTLENTNALGNQNYGDMTHKIWNAGWTTPKDFYAIDDPNLCNGRDPWIDDDAKINCGNPLLKCVATNQNVIFNQVPPDPNVTPEFANCANSANWLQHNCLIGSCWICVPCSYMGPILAETGVAYTFQIQPGCFDTCL